MLVDFPDYSAANPWQRKTLEPCANMRIERTSRLTLMSCYALHISWEDILLRGCDNEVKAHRLITQVDEYLKRQSRRSKIVWTVHNITSHWYGLKDAEKKLRSVIANYASTINLMSYKHSFIIPKKHQCKINIVPHYIEPSRFVEIKKKTAPTFFKYGADRGRVDNDFYVKVLNDSNINKFVSDARLNFEVDTADTVITKRRFTVLEAELYAQLANFSTFFQRPQFNSGVMNFLIGSKVAVFHDCDSVRYMDIPHSFERYRIDLSKLERLSVSDIRARLEIDDLDIDSFIAQRTPTKVSSAFWKGVIS